MARARRRCKAGGRLIMGGLSCVWARYRFSLGGRLARVSPCLAFPGARVYLAPIFLHSQGRSGRVAGRLLCALQWWARFLQQVPRRRIPVNPAARPRILLYTDATGRGELCWAAETPWGRAWAAAGVPRSLRRWVVRRKKQAWASAVFARRRALVCRPHRLRRGSWWRLSSAWTRCCSIASVTPSRRGRLRHSGPVVTSLFAGAGVHRQQRGSRHPASRGVQARLLVSPTGDTPCSLAQAARLERSCERHLV